MSLESYLRELADPAIPLVVSKLISLSSLDPDEASLFHNTWLEMALEQRRHTMETLIDVAEDNVELNFDAIFFIALGDVDAEVRRSAIKGLWEYEGRDLVDPLLGLLRHDPDARVRAETALALGRFVLKAELDTLRTDAAERVEEALRGAFENGDEVAEVRGRALESIGARSEPWVSDLIRQAVQSGDRRLHLSALHAMGRSCDVAWLSTLIPELESDDDEVRFEAAMACGSTAADAATPHLLPLLDDEDPEVQEAAISALGEIGGAEANEGLENLLARADERVRAAVLSALDDVDFSEDPFRLKVRGDEDG